MEQEIEKMNPEQRSAMEEWIELGMNIMAHYGIDQSKTVYENLDNVYEAWIRDPKEKPTNEAIVVGLGSVFGSRLGVKHSIEWSVITDQYGTDFAVIINGHQIYPMDFVAKRVNIEGEDEREFGFFSGMDSIIDERFAR